MTPHSPPSQQVVAFPRNFLPLGMLLLVGIFTACGHPSASSEAQGFPLRLDGVAFTAELAITPEEMTTGLMHRGELAPDHGMLFVYQEPGRRSFWMKNTHIPLDLGFFTADGTLQEITALTPYELTPVPSRRSDIIYALEMNRGWFARQDLKPGVRLDMDAVNRAVEQRRSPR